MSKVIGAKRRDFDGYSVWTFVDDANVTTQVLQRDFGDYLEVTPLPGLVIDDETGLPGAFARVQEELRSKYGDELPDLPPAATVKFPKLLGEDPIKRRKVWAKAKEEGLNQLRSNAMARANEKARLGIKAIKLGIKPSSGELNKDYNGEIGAGLSS